MTNIQPVGAQTDRFGASQWTLDRIVARLAAFANRMISMRNHENDRNWKCGLIVAVMGVAGWTSANAESPDVYLGLHVHAGERYADIFSKAISVKGAGFDEIVRRISGTATYDVVSSDAEGPTFKLSYRYDGRPAGENAYQIRDGGKTGCNAGACSTNSDTSGLAFNPLLWGLPHGELRAGMTWTIKIEKPWEAGPPGTETVRVMSVDAKNKIVMLEREGSGDGASDDDQRQLPIVVDGKSGMATIVSGPSRWSGQIAVKSGIVISDEILVERHVKLQSTLGNFEGDEREYTLLNAMPADG